MADYRDMAAALSGGYGQDTGPITADTLITLKNGKTASAGDLLGMLKGFGQAVGSNLESLGRGGVASVIGAGGDLESFGRMGINKLYGAGGVNVSETPVLPTTTDILGMMPRGTATRPETAGMEELGGYMTPATAKVLKPAVMATGRLAGQEIANVSSGMPSRSLLGDITPKPKKIFIGENAQTWNKAAADQAVQMEKAGAKPEDIWSATGTFRGPEGKLRQEISDHASKMTQVAKDKIEANQYFSGPMGEAFENEPLFNAYPKLHWMDTFVNKELRGGTFLPEKQMINIMMPTESGQRSVALHELQHAVQQKEKFARGGSPKSIGDLKGDLMGMQDKYNFLASEYFTATDDIVKSNILQELDYLKPRIEALQNLKNIDPEEGYMRLAGETEARAVQSRMNLTDAERRAKFPYESYDVPINDLIVTK